MIGAQSDIGDTRHYARRLATYEYEFPFLIVSLGLTNYAGSKRLVSAGVHDGCGDDVDRPAVVSTIIKREKAQNPRFVNHCQNDGNRIGRRRDQQEVYRGCGVASI